MIGLIYIQYIKNRQLEIQLLRVNGLSRREIVTLFIVELITQTLMLSVVSMGMIIFVYHYTCEYFGVQLLMDYPKTVALCVMCVFSFMLIPSMIGVLFFQKNDVAKALRSNI